MSRQRRYYPSGHFYEVIIRAREGLPLPSLDLIKLIILSALARTQRDSKVTLCHYVWMGNHAHLGCCSHDASQFKAFYQELQKKITDALKRLLGLDYFEIWEGSPIVALIGDPEAAVQKIAYWYANPARADLVDRIEDYPGLSTWQDFRSASNDIDASVTHEVPWVRLNTLERLPSRRLSRRQDEHITKRISESSKVKNKLILKPNAWMACFGITSPNEVAQWNERILQVLDEKQQAARTRRVTERKKIVGVKKLLDQAIAAPFKREKEETKKRVFIITTSKELRFAFIETLRALSQHCRKLFQQWKRGDFHVTWPPGVFIPPPPPTANALLQF